MAKDLTLEDAAKELDVSLSTVKREIADGNLVPTHYRGCTRIAPGDLEEYRKRCRSVGTVGGGRLDSGASSRKLADLSAAIAMLPSLTDVLARESKIIALDERRTTRSRKRSRAG